MLSSVLKSERAVKVNIAIMRAFVQMRKMVTGIRRIQKMMAEAGLSPVQYKWDSFVVTVVFQLQK